MTEKHNVFKDADTAQANVEELTEVDKQGKVTFTKVDRFIVNDCTADPGNPARLCDMQDGPYYIVSVIA